MTPHKPALALLLLTVGSQACAAALALCPERPADADVRVLESAQTPDGRWRTLRVSDRPMENCVAVELALAPARIVAARIISREQARILAAGFALQAPAARMGLTSAELVPVDAPPDAAPPVTVGVELAETLSATTFGREERATFDTARRPPTLRCGKGRHPAGVVLRVAGRGLPPGIALAAALRYRATGTFLLGATDRPRADANPLPLAALAPDHGSVRPALPQAGFEQESLQSFTLACPGQAAELVVDSLRITPQQPDGPAPPRALWSWQASAWLTQSAALLDKLKNSGADTVFITVPVVQGKAAVVQPRRLARFVAGAGARGIRVWAVAGDPGAVLEGERGKFVAMARAYQRYNAAAPEAARLAGVQFDIEPYLNHGYAIDPAAWHEAYLATMALLRQATTMRIDAAVPFWWNTAATADGPLLARLAASVDSLTVMNYRTDPAQIKRSAQPFLEWSLRHKRGVRIALEAGPIDDETLRHYRPAARGTLAIVALGDQAVLVEFDGARALPGASSFGFSHQTMSDGGRVGFAEKRAALLRLLPELESLWRAWPGFSGVALHEF
ncbi:hypothetical protein [Massilia glaciei]|uniref:Uncharacterized protein n=1 Tax=Massilia glaciei TaxID=1524097 RepID=A0A2U2I6I6_9BURK|nr:hypothetical protein [Massilia glaciei]PWF55383.1 hypothetical protein C7C56_002105 [Massilia glaciei]